VSHLRHGQHVNAHLARGTVYSFVAKVLGMGIGFIMQLVLARMIGAEDMGVYYFALSWVTILTTVACLGFDVALVRHVAVYLSQADHARLRGLLMRANRWCLIAGLIGTGAIWVWFLISRPHWAFDKKAALLIASFLIPGFTLSALRQAVLRGMKKIFQFQALDMILRPVLIIAAAVAWPLFTQVALSAEHVLLIQLATTLAILILGVRLVNAQLPHTLHQTAPVFETRAWLETAMPLYLGTLMRVVTLQAGLIIIGSFLPNDQVGIYGVILRLAELVVFGVGLVDAIAAPMIAELFHAGRMQELQRLVTFATRITFALAVLASLALYFGGHWILGLYGADFQAGHRAMGIVMFAYILQGLVGPVGYMMSMTDQQKPLVLIQGVAMVVNLGLSFALIPTWGIEGAATALAVSTIVWQGWMFVFVKRRFGIRSTIF
jgi:O-antigen/teichoic acid export membrane protein